MSTCIMTLWLSCASRRASRRAAMAIELAGPQLEDTETAGVIARPPLIFLATLILGFVMDHLVPVGFPISRIGPAHWISAHDRWGNGPYRSGVGDGRYSQLQSGGNS